MTKDNIYSAFAANTLTPTRTSYGHTAIAQSVHKTG